MQKAAPKGAAFCFGHDKEKNTDFTPYTFPFYFAGLLKIDSSTLPLTVTLLVIMVIDPI